MHLDDAAEYLVDYIRKPRPTGGYPTFGYDFYLANVIGILHGRGRAVQRPRVDFAGQSASA